jgi:hypothetical protein
MHLEFDVPGVIKMELQGVFAAILITRHNWIIIELLASPERKFVSCSVKR